MTVLLNCQVIRWSTPSRQNCKSNDNHHNPAKLSSQTIFITTLLNCPDKTIVNTILSYCEAKHEQFTHSYSTGEVLIYTKCHHRGNTNFLHHSISIALGTAASDRSPSGHSRCHRLKYKQQSRQLPAMDWNPRSVKGKTQPLPAALDRVDQQQTVSRWGGGDYNGSSLAASTERDEMRWDVSRREETRRGYRRGSGVLRFIATFRTTLAKQWRSRRESVT